MRFLPKWTLSHRTVAFLVIGVVIYMGVTSFLAMPRRQMPAIPIPIAQVITMWPGASTEDMEALVTKKLELRFSEISDVKAVYSTTKPGMSIIIVELVYGKPTKENWDKLRNKVDQVRHELPKGVMGPDINDEFADTAALLLTVSGDRFSYRQLKQYCERIRDRLKRIDSVGKVEIAGAQEEIVNLTTRPTLSVSDLPSLYKAASTLKKKNIVFPGAEIYPGGNVVKLKTSGRISEVRQLESIILSQNPRTGHVTTVKDLFRVKRTYRRPKHLIRARGVKSMAISVTMREGHNVIKMGMKVDTALAELKTSLPKDLRIEKVADQPKLVNKSIQDFMINLAEAIAIVLVVAILFMGVRSGLIMAFAIPMSMLLAFIVLKLIGWDLQTISIASLIIALGMLVDNAIVITDNIYAKIEEGQSPFEAAWKGTSELTAPVLTSTLTTVAIFLPLGFMPSISGDFIRSIPVVVSTVLVASFLVAMTVTPMASYYFLRIKKKLAPPPEPEQEPTSDDKPTAKGDSNKDGNDDAEEEKRSDPLKTTRELPRAAMISSTMPSIKAPPGEKRNWLGTLGAGYSRLMTGALRRPWLVIAISVGAFFASCAGMYVVPKEFFPNAERDTFVIDVWLPEGSDIEATDRVVKRVERRLAREQKVARYSAFVGKGAPRFELGLNPEAQAPNYGLLVVTTTDEKHTPGLVSRLQKEFDKTIADGRVTAKRFQAGPAVANPVEVRIFGEDLVVLRRLAERTKGLLRAVSGTYDIKDSLGYNLPNLDVRVDDYRASLAGLDNQAVAQGLRNQVSGIDAGSFLEGDEMIPIRMRIPTFLRRNAQVFASANLPLYASQGKARSTLLQLASIHPRWDVARIDRRNNERYVTVSCKVRNVLASQVITKVAPKLKKLGLPAGYRYEIAGEAESRNEGFADLGNAMFMGVILIIILLVLQFNSLRHTLVILGTLPLALVGALLGLLITGNAFGFMAFLGIISLMGVVVNNALVLLDFVQVKIAEGLDYREALRVAGLRRMRPILLTMLTTVGGLIPLMLTGGALWEAMSAVLIFGLMVATLLTLVVIPCVYAVVVKDRDQIAAQKPDPEPQPVEETA
jgi:multidrug efflux pump